MAGKRKRDNKETNEEPDTKVHKNVDAQTVHVSPKQTKKDKKKDKKEKKKEEKTKKEEATDFEETKTEKKKNKKKEKKKSVEPEPSPKKETKKSAPAFKAVDYAEFRKTHEINVDLSAADDIPPICTFEECISRFPATEELVSAFCEGFKQPTPIQSQCWPISLSGRDVIGIAETGSGKTLGFLVPGIVKILAENKNIKRVKQPSILVLAPTRELAMQGDETCNKASAKTGIKSICIAGGMDRNAQTSAITRGTQVVFATPGRLISLIEACECDLSKISYLVLDEADRMLDMGFEPEIRKIIANIPATRQTMMFSATWPEEIRELAQKYLKNPVKVTIGSDDLSACNRVTQIVEIVDQRDKDRKLETLLRKYHDRKNRVLIFCLYKKEAARVESSLARKGWNVCGIHGDMGQNQRTDAFQKFKSGTVPLLVATDVAARGLDIPNVEYVINYTFPLTIEDYIHRIGRTGRANKTGIAHTFFTVLEKTKGGDLCKVLRDANQVVPPELEKFGPSIKKKKSHDLYGTAYEAPATMKAATRIKFD